VAELHRFDVFGRLVGVEATDGGWRAYFLDGEGKRRTANLVIPSFVTADGLQRYLADVFHESARPDRPDVRRLE